MYIYCLNGIHTVTNGLKTQSQLKAEMSTILN